MLQIHWTANNNFFPDRDGQEPLFIVLHGTAGGSSAQAIADYFASTQGTANPVSSHYVIGQDGAVVQCISEQNGAWCNGALTAGHDSFWDNYAGINPNNLTISIEHVKPSTDNSDQLTQAQQAASFALIDQICQRWHIPRRAADVHGGITGHFSLDPVNRSECPGQYPWNKLWSYLEGNSTVPTKPTQPSQPAELSSFQLQDAQLEWNITEQQLGGPQSFNSGIANSWKEYYQKSQRFGPPITKEYSSLDWSGKHIICQEFLHARAEYNPATGVTSWYDARGLVE